jgi:hypothetical protein
VYLNLNLNWNWNACLSLPEKGFPNGLTIEKWSDGSTVEEWPDGLAIERSGGLTIEEWSDEAFPVMALIRLELLAWEL